MEDDNFVEFDVTDDHEEFPSGDEAIKESSICDNSEDSDSEDKCIESCMKSTNNNATKTRRQLAFHS